MWTEFLNLNQIMVELLSQLLQMQMAVPGVQSLWAQNRQCTHLTHTSVGLKFAMFSSFASFEMEGLISVFIIVNQWF